MNITDESLQKLQGMSREDMQETLKSDPLYQQVLKAVPNDQRELIESIALDFMHAWQTGVTDNLSTMATNPEFVAALMRVMQERGADS